MPEKNTDDQQLIEKIERYCAYQERCKQEVGLKLKKLGTDENKVEKLIAKLEDNGFVNEQRFSKSFSREKFKLNHWGKIKIAIALKAKGISEKYIREGISEIPGSEYSKTLKSLLSKKDKTLNETNDFIRKNKLANYAVGKGFEPELVWEMIENKKG